MQKYDDQEQQHKLNERKNVKTIKELKLEMSRMKKEIATLTEKTGKMKDVEASSVSGSAAASISTKDDCNPNYEPQAEFSYENLEALIHQQEINAKLAFQLSEVWITLGLEDFL
jgi:hypothetical protein